jgi:TRAP-type transport system periplasmic protein
MKNREIRWAWVAVLAFSFVFLAGSPAFAQTVNWKFASYVASSNKGLGVGHKWWAEQVEKRSNGQIKVKIFWADELSGTKEMMQTVQSGLADVVAHAPVYTPGETPIWNAAYLPFLAPARVDQALMVYNRLANESKVFKAELDKFNCVFGGSHDSSSNNLMGKKPVRNLQDLKGLRVRCMPDLGKILREYGSVPVSVPVPETYTSLDSGIVDVVVFASEGFRTWKIDEISKYLTIEMDMGALPSFYYINKDQWNKLPENLKKVVQSVIDEQPAVVAEIVSKLKVEADDMVKAKNIEVLRFPREDREKLAAKSAAIWEEWAKRSKSPEACKAALADYLKIRDDVVAKHPQGMPAKKN